MRILKEQSTQTIAKVVSIAYRLWLPLSINSVPKLTKLRSVIFIYITFFVALLISSKIFFVSFF